MNIWFLIGLIVIILILYAMRGILKFILKPVVGIVLAAVAVISQVAEWVTMMIMAVLHTIFSLILLPFKKLLGKDVEWGKIFFYRRPGFSYRLYHNFLNDIQIAFCWLTEERWDRIRDKRERMNDERSALIEREENSGGVGSFFP